MNNVDIPADAVASDNPSTESIIESAFERVAQGLGHPRLMVILTILQLQLRQCLSKR